jgi:hypothetical protein
MKSIHPWSATIGSGLRVHLFRTVVVACAVFVASPVLAQEDAAASGGDMSRAGSGQGDGAATKGTAGAADGAAMTNHGIDPVTPQRGPAGLQRRANLKALVAAPRQAGGLPVANARVVPSLMHPGTGSAVAVPRNAIGIAMPGVRLPGHDGAPTTTQAGTRLTGLGNASAAGNAGAETRRMPVPAGAPPMLHGGGINGTAMGRMTSGSSSIGGPAKDRLGINGTLIRPKH